MDELELIKQKKLKEMINKFREVELKMDVTDNNFEENVIEKSKKIPVLIDFWADWCVPCNILSPILEKVIASYKGKLILVKMNVDENPKTSNKFAINAIPAVKLFKGGKEVVQFIGVVPENTIRQLINKNL